MHESGQQIEGRAANAAVRYRQGRVSQRMFNRTAEFSLQIQRAHRIHIQSRSRREHSRTDAVRGKPSVDCAVKVDGSRRSQYAVPLMPLEAPERHHATVESSVKRHIGQRIPADVPFRQHTARRNSRNGQSAAEVDIRVDAAMNRIVFRVCNGKHRGKVALLDLHLARKGFAADIDYHAERIYAAVLLERERVQLDPRSP